VTRRTLDEIVNSTEHAEPMHPVRALFQHRFYLGGFVSSEGGLWLAMLNALLLIPLVMAAFFYPVPVLIGVGAALLVGFAAYEAYAIWHRRTHSVH
jgi:hypothetical protein